MRRTYEVKIYSAHDCDLYSIYMLYKFNFPKAIYCSLNAFLKKQSVAIKMPERRKSSPIRRKVYRTTLILDDRKNAELVRLLDSVRQGYRNCFIKNILRLYLFSPGTELFFVSDEAFTNANDLMLQMREGHKPINAAEKKRSKAKTKSINNGIGEATGCSDALPTAVTQTNSGSPGNRDSGSNKEPMGDVTVEYGDVKLQDKPQETDKKKDVPAASEKDEALTTETKESNTAGINQQAITNILFDIISQ